MTRNDAENAVHRVIREEGRRLTAALIHRLGTQHLELAEEDVTVAHVVVGATLGRLVAKLTRDRQPLMSERTRADDVT